MALPKLWTSLSAVFLTGFVGLLCHGTPSTAGTLKTDDFFILQRQPSASIMQLDPHYKNNGLFMSQVYEAGHSFELLGLNWQQKLPEGTEAGIEIRFRAVDGTWSSWQDIHVDEDAPSQDKPTVAAGYDQSVWSYVITEKSDAFQYRASLSTEDTGVTPKLSDISFDYVEGGESSPISKISAQFQKLVFDKNQDIISRDEWGADESLRVSLSKNTDFTSELDTSEVEDDPDMKIVKVVDEDENGDPLLWPQEYPAEVKKIFIHHTASTENLDDPETAIRAIYYYHAVTRGWGDIGYNFIVAPDGTVYEGRAGGDGVVAGHAQGYNTGSVGIALLGNYQEEDVAGPMMKGLQALIYEKAKLHNIDPDGTSEFRGEVSDNIMGHRDVSATACPGEFAYDYLSDIRTMVALAMDADDSTSKDKNYSYSESGDRDLVVLLPEESTTVEVKIKNTGTKTWDKNTFLTVNANKSADSLISIPKDSSKRTALMKETSVKPGATATFSFTVDSKTSGGLASFDMSPVFNGKEKSSQLMQLAFFVESPILDFSVKSTTAPSTLAQGTSSSVTVTVKNTGNLTWTNAGDNTVTLIKNGSSSLSSKSTLATLNEASVEPGKTGTFTFSIKAPAKGGTYSLYFSPSMKGSSALSKSSGQIKVKVSETSSSQKAVILGTSEDLTFSPGEERTLWIQIQNTSSSTWSSTGSSALKLSFGTLKGFTIGTPVITFKELKSQSATKVYFKVKASTTPGTYTLSVQPKLGSKNLLSKAYSLSLTVEDAATTTSTYEDPIRIKLTPDNEVGSPIVTSASAFSLYDGSTFLKNFSANARVKITAATDGTFSVSSGSSKWVVKEAVRLVPEEDGIMEVATMQQVPAWNTALNDNKFRGTIEVRTVDEETVLINELPLEDYIKGIAEVSNGDNIEKVKTILVLARTYAYYYLTEDEKFAGKPYDLDDDPETSQKYLGYGFESRSENVAQAAEDTAGEVVTYKNKVVKTPYFSQSDGKATKSAKSVWGWTNTPWLVSVSDKYCTTSDGTFQGHGVGLSGCGATGMAALGKSFEEIIKYYYTGVTLSTIDDLKK